MIVSALKKIFDMKKIFDTKNILFWFRANWLKANAGKFQFMMPSRNNHRRQWMILNYITVKESNEAILFGITIYNKLVLTIDKKHIENLCRAAQYKLHALKCIGKYLALDTAVLHSNTFLNSQFNYAPLMWMLCRKTLYHKIRPLKVICK